MGFGQTRWHLAIFTPNHGNKRRELGIEKRQYFAIEVWIETKFSKTQLLLLNDKELNYQTNDKAARNVFKWKSGVIIKDISI